MGCGPASPRKGLQELTNRAAAASRGPSIDLQNEKSPVEAGLFPYLVLIDVLLQRSRLGAAAEEVAEVEAITDVSSDDQRIDSVLGFDCAETCHVLPGDLDVIAPRPS